MTLSFFINKLRQHQSLSEEEAFRAIQHLFESSPNPELSSQFLSLLHQKGETVDELVGFSKYLISQMIPVNLSKPAVDVCGTGGSNQNRFNISTASALCCAAMGIPVAKHGNRGSRKPNGSFDFIEALGIPLLEDPALIQTLFEKTSICFLFARVHHPIMKQMAVIRQQLSHPTFFNFIGPLCNPAQVPYQILGTADSRKVNLLARVKQTLGTQISWVFSSEDGSDELNGSVGACYQEVTSGAIQEKYWSPNSELGMTIPIPFGSTAKENATHFIQCLNENNWAHSIIQTVCINAGLTSFMLGLTDTSKKGFTWALDTFKSGAVKAKLDEVIQVSKQLL